MKNVNRRTARRDNAEMQINLQKRREWFDQDGQQQPPAASDGTGNTVNNSGENQGDYIPRTRFNEVLGERNALGERLRGLEAAEAARQRQKAEDEGRYQDVIAALEPKANRADALEKLITEMVAAEVESVPEKFKGLIPNLEPAEKLAWIRNAQRSGLFGGSLPAAPNLDAGGGGDRPDTAKLSAEETKAAAKMGIKPEDYHRYKSKGQK